MKRNAKRKNKIVAVWVFLLLASCVPQSHVSPSPVAASPSPSLTLPPGTATATITATPAPTPTMTFADAIRPYTIQGLRARKYPAGQIEVVGALDQTHDYTRYLIRYPSDDLTITGIMQIPAQGQPPYPVIVMSHGFFPRTEYVAGDGTDRAAEFLNKNGYMTLAPDYRSWGQSDTGPSLFYSGLAIDVVNLLAAISSLPEADASRVGMWGHSMGGGVTMKALAITGGRAVPSNGGEGIETIIRAAVLYSTVSADQADVLARWGLGCFGNIIEGEGRSDCNSSDVIPLSLPGELLDAYYVAASDPETLSAVSPIDHLDLVTAPVQIHYGTRDGEETSGTPPEWSKKLYQAFLDAGKPAKLFGYEGQRHSFSGDAWYRFMEEAVRFFDENVKNASG
ncbi:MAG: hypothetical protein HFACDABA_01853 [Anaerolineales bacterium]|nr:hypothetical protein [Anaerolineales bacterium]